MPNRQHQHFGVVRPVRPNPDPPELAGLSGRQKVKKRKALARAQREAARRAAGLAEVLQVQQQRAVFDGIDPRARLVAPAPARVAVPHRRPPSLRPG